MSRDEKIYWALAAGVYLGTAIMLVQDLLNRS